MSPRRRSALVTGGQGFIGSWLVERLLDDGARVLVPRRPPRPESRFAREGLKERCEVVSLDLLDHDSVLRVLNEHDVGVVFHLAARTIAADAGRSPYDAFEVNVRGTWSVLEAARLARLAGLDVGVVVAGTYHAYGPTDGSPMREDLALRAVHPYGASKACADQLARSYAATYEMPVAVTRLANVYGGGDLEFSRIVPDAARALVAAQAPVVRSDGTPERDFLHVDDAVDAYLAVERSLEAPELYGRAWNAGAEAPVAVGELVRMLIAASGRDLEPDVVGTPSSVVDRQHLDSSAIKDELGWEPRRGLEEGLALTWGWYAENLA